MAWHSLAASCTSPWRQTRPLAATILPRNALIGFSGLGRTERTWLWSRKVSTGLSLPVSVRAPSASSSRFLRPPAASVPRRAAMLRRVPRLLPADLLVMDLPPGWARRPAALGKHGG